jgi:hypothetical protein
MMFWSAVRIRFSCAGSGDPMSVVRIWVSTFCSRSIGSGSVIAMPEFTERLYLPNKVTTPRSCGLTMWKLVNTTHRSRKTPRP